MNVTDIGEWQRRRHRVAGRLHEDGVAVPALAPGDPRVIVEDLRVAQGFLDEIIAEAEELADAPLLAALGATVLVLDEALQRALAAQEGGAT